MGDRAISGNVVTAGTDIDIAMPENIFPTGWVLLRGIVIWQGRGYDARLYYDIGEGFFDGGYFEISPSAKGVINELIYLPAGIKRMKFSLMAATGEFNLSPLSFTKVDTTKRIWHMLCRVVAMIYRHPRQKRKSLGLNIFRLLTDLQGAYRASGKLSAHAAAPNYSKWIAQFDTLGVSDLRKIKNHIRRFTYHPHFYVLLVADVAANAFVQKTLASLSKQIYRSFSCVVLEIKSRDHSFEIEMDDTEQGVNWSKTDNVAAWLETFNAKLCEHPEKEWVMLLRAGDELAPHALYRFAWEALTNAEAAVLYSDDDVLTVEGQRSQPRFKPDWSLTHMRETNFVDDAVVFRGIELVKAGGLSLGCCQHGCYDLVLRTVDVAGDAGTGKVVHIPAVLLHRAEENRKIWSGGPRDVEAAQAHLGRNNVHGEVLETLPGCRRIRYQLPDVPPLVSIIVPMRDALELSRQCLETLLKKTTYPRFEILVVDNQSVGSDTLRYLGQIDGHDKVRVLRYDQPFNYSAMNNMAVREAHCDIICLLNNDTEVISPGWLDEMVGHLLQPKVGVVGAKLYFPNGRIQHGGDLVGVGGIANHAHSFLLRDDAGYCNRTMVAQELSAVTGACLLTWRTLFVTLGGLNAVDLPVAFNDVDYCLRVREAGYRVVWTPYAELYHHESVSRGADESPKKIRRARGEVAYMRKRWRHVMHHDPFYNPNLSYERPDFSLSNAPMVKKPWLD